MGVNMIIKNLNSVNNTVVVGNKVTINGVELPLAPCEGYKSTIINSKVYLDGYEFKNGQWKRTLKALWHLLF